jgi:hypothetical protein
VLPVVQPLVPKPGTGSAMNNNLVVRTTRANLAEVRRVLDAIDRAPRRLMITVRQDADANRTTGGFEASGRISGDAGRIVVPGGRGEPAGGEIQVGRGDDRIGARVYGTQALENDRTSQQVQVLEGSQAFISVGQSVPVPAYSVTHSGIRGRVVERRVDSVEYRDILTGFHVRPQLAGDVVTLEITPQRDTPGNQGRGSIDVQRLGTTVSGRLGEWIEVGGIVSGRSFESSGTVYRTQSTESSDRRVLLRVEEIR